MLGIDLTSSNLGWARSPWPRLITRVSGQPWWRLGLIGLVSLAVGGGLSGCQDAANAQPRTIALEQSWELDLGDVIEGFPVVASLGDVSLYLHGSRVSAPFDGEVEMAAIGDSCIFFSAPAVPAYLFRYCGLKNAQIGQLQEGDFMGKATFLHFATLRRQPEGTWTIVEPSTHVLERSLERY